MNRKTKIIFGSVVAIVIALVVIIFWIVLKPKELPGVEENLVSEPVSAPNQSLEIEDSRFFFVRDNNIFSYDLENDQIKLTNYAKNPDSSPSYDENGVQIPNRTISNLEYLDKNRLGYGMCSIVIGDYGCGVYIINLITKEIRELERFSKGTLVTTLGISKMEQYAYLSSSTDDPDNITWDVSLGEKGVSRKVLSSEFSAYGRGPSMSDSTNIRFSNDSKYFFKIATSAPKIQFDATTHVFEVSTLKETIIQNSTHPNWLDDTHIVYTHIKSGEEEKLFVYDLLNNTETELKNIASVTSSAVFNNKQILFTNTYQTWIYNLSTETPDMIITSALSPKWLNSKSILYLEFLRCDGEPDCGGLAGPYKNGDYVIYNIETKESFSLNNIIQTRDSIYTQYN